MKVELDEEAKAYAEKRFNQLDEGWQAAYDAYIAGASRQCTCIIDKPIYEGGASHCPIHSTSRRRVTDEDAIDTSDQGPAVFNSGEVEGRKE